MNNTNDTSSILSNEIQFIKGNNKKLQLNNQNIINKYTNLFEQFDEEDNDEVNFSHFFKKPNGTPPKDQIKLDFSKAMVKQESKTIPQQIPIKISNQNDKNSFNFKSQFLLKKKDKEDVKIISQSISLDDGKKNSITSSQEPNRSTISTVQKVNKIERYQKNIILLVKARKLYKWLVGDLWEYVKNVKKLKEIINFSDLKLPYVNVRKLSQPSIIRKDEKKFLKNYFKINYPKYFEKQVDWIAFKIWLKQQYTMISWKQNGLKVLYDVTKQKLFLTKVKKNRDQIYSKNNLLLEFEYRFYVQYQLNQRTLLQKIMEKDEFIGQHIVLLVCNIEFNQKQNRYFVQLSDGWYSIILILNYQPKSFQETNDQIICKLLQTNKITIGDKIRFCNLNIFDLQPDKIESHLVTNLLQLQSSILFCTAQLNSTKRAKSQDKLGSQCTKYFLKSIKSIRGFGGLIPALDLFLIQKSYCWYYDNQNKILFDPQDDSQVELPQKNFTYILKCFDVLHYFENTSIDRIVYLLVKGSYALYNTLSIGDRFRVINSRPQTISLKEANLAVNCFKDSGIILEDMKQYKTYARQQISILTQTIYTSPLEKDHKLDLVFFVYEVILEKREIVGIVEKDYIVRLEISNVSFYGDKIKSQRLLRQSVIINDVRVKYFQKNYKPYILHCIATELTTISVKEDHWLDKYQEQLIQLKQFCQKS